ncbi:hypothetical protein CASFOL_039018 [Castilleja foliolosa]|uniref:Piwi domain-containing protein n=1 Tax=Castilleja foliolosa TaxID=1961234 RepID=A0ABD3BHE4_9LAMI
MSELNLLKIAKHEPLFINCQINEFCKFLDEKWNPKFVVIVAQKNHHTNFSRRTRPIMFSQGTMRPTHYHVLIDEVDFSPDDLQELVHSLSYVCVDLK